MTPENPTPPETQTTKQSTPSETQITKQPRKYLLPILLGASLVLIAGVVFAVLGISGKLGGSRNKPEFEDKFLEEPSYDTSTLAYSELLEIAAKALEDGDYDAAIENYEKVLEMDDTVVDAYLGLIEAYIRMGDFEKALEIAKKGYAKTNDPSIKEKIDMIENGNIQDARGLVYKETTYDGNGQIMYYHTYTYDKNSHRATVTSFDASGVETGHVDFVSDSSNIEILYATNGDTGVVSKMVVEKDSQGKSVKRTNYDEQGEVMDYLLYEYEGDKTIETEYSLDGQVHHRYINYPEGDAQVWELYHYNSWDDSFTMYRREISTVNRNEFYDGEGNLDYYSVYEENGWVDYNPDGSVRQYSVEE